MACHECGGPEDDAQIRKRMGCDCPAPKAITIRYGKTIETTFHCPRKMMREATPYLRAFSWYKSGNLRSMYPDEIPSNVAEAIELIDREQHEQLAEQRKQ
jgi:NMD protein affecting ribosome stability and mRNA decay